MPKVHENEIGADTSRPVLSWPPAITVTRLSVSVTECRPATADAEQIERAVPGLSKPITEKPVPEPLPSLLKCKYTGGGDTELTSGVSRSGPPSPSSPGSSPMFRHSSSKKLRASRRRPNLYLTFHTQPLALPAPQAAAPEPVTSRARGPLRAARLRAARRGSARCAAAGIGCRSAGRKSRPRSAAWAYPRATGALTEPKAVWRQAAWLRTQGRALGATGVAPQQDPQTVRPSGEDRRMRRPPA